MSSESPVRDLDIAIIGQACRVPGADCPETFWQLIVEGREGIMDVDDASLRRAGVTDRELGDPHYVRRSAIMNDVMGFDAGFFGLSALDAALLDPQHRHFLEVCWEALESAAHAPARFDGRVGVFGGVGMQGYFANHLLPNDALMREHGLFLVRHTGNDKDFLTTRVSYEFDLRGPSVAVQTACSTSLVAVHVAAQSLLNMECDLALAGGVTIELPHGVGYTHVPGEILSPDGRCRSFDSAAAGTVFGSGCGVVALRRAVDAYNEGDNILAIIRATAINNDGRRKVGYLAPSVDGQAAAIAEALELAEVAPEDIGLVEAHGTATPVGDPIEVAALREAFGDVPSGDRCVLGSVKSNIGHLDTAAGVASLIKVTEALRHKVLPPTLHFSSPNPALNLEVSPFHVLSEARPWSDASTRYACVNSIGVGGTNAHAVLAAAPALPARTAAAGPYWLPISAKSPRALDAMCAALAAWLDAHPEADLGDMTFTLQEGRAELHHRAVVAGHTRDELANALRRSASAHVATSKRRIVWAFAGGGAAWPGMLRVVYERFPAVRREADACFAALEQLGATGIRAAVLEPSTAPSEFERPSIGLPSLMVAQLALAAQLSAWGITPDVCVGHSMGEYTAACIAGSIARSDALRIVLERGRLFETLPDGAMLSVNSSAETLRGYLDPSLDIAADNASALSLASGKRAAILALHEQLTAAGIDSQVLRISVAAHSQQLEPILQEFEGVVRRMSVSRPNIEVISTRLAKSVQDEWRSPTYWVEHLRHPVRFREAMQQALAAGPSIVFDVGPGRTMAALAEANDAWSDQHAAFQTLSRSDEQEDHARTTLEAFAAPWLCGAPESWSEVRATRAHRRVGLPTYQWQHDTYAFDRPSPTSVAAHSPNNLYGVSLEPHAGEAVSLSPGAVVVAHCGDPNTVAMVRDLLPDRRVLSLEAGATTQRIERFAWTISDDDEEVLQRLQARHGDIAAWIDVREGDAESTLRRIHALGVSAQATDTALLVLFLRLRTEQAQSGVVIGAAPVLQTELPHVRARFVDLTTARSATRHALLTELTRADLSWATWRDGLRYRRVPSPAASAAEQETLGWDEERVLVVSGGFGGIAQQVIRGFAGEHPGLRVALLSRTGLPNNADGSPPSDRHLTIQQLEQLGCRVLALAVDVCDAHAVASAVATVERRLGPVGGVLHTAGHLDDALIGTRSFADLRAVLSPKTAGARHLADAIAHRADAWLVSFSSTSAFAGLPGQLAYAAANAWLDEFSQTLRSQGRRALSIAWPAWRETGMAATLLATLRGEYGAPSIAGPRTRVVERTADRLKLRIQLSHADWVIADHRLRGGGGVLPAAAILSYVYGAALELGTGPFVSLTDVVFERPVFVADERGLFLRVDGGVWTLEGDDETVFCRGRLERIGEPRSSDSLRAPNAAADWRPPDAPQHTYMAFGDRWDCVDAYAHVNGARWTKLRLQPAHSHDLTEWPVHPALLDFAIASGVSLSQNTAFFVPFSIERISFFGHLAAISVSRVTLAEETSESLTFDAQVVDEKGRLSVTVHGFEQRAVAQVDALVRRSAASDLANAANALETALSRGIDNRTGVRAFLQALAVPGAAHLIVHTTPPLLGKAEVKSAAPSVVREALPGSAAESETEVSIAAIWESLLGAPVTDVDADFFQLGGHSLNAIRLVSRLNERFGTALPMRAPFDAPTVRALGALVDETVAGSASPVLSTDPAEPASVEATRDGEATPTMTSAQRGIWFREHTSPPSTGFHVCGAYRLARTPDRDALSAAVSALFARHAALRCRFPAAGGEPHVVVLPADDLSLEWHAHVDAVSWPDAIARVPFDIERGPLCRIHLAEVAGSEGGGAILALVVHHLVCDEWSLEVMIRELGELYAAALRHTPGDALRDALPPAPNIFVANAEPAPSQAALDARREALVGATTTLALPHDHARAGLPTGRGRRCVRRAPTAVNEALRMFSSDAGVSVFVTTLSLYLAFVSRWTGQSDVLVGTPASTRETRELESAVGLFIDTVVVRGELDDAPSLSTLARRMRDAVLRASGAERVPFGDLVRVLSGRRNAGVHPIYQTMLAVYPVDRSLTLGDINATALHVDAGGAQVDLTLYVADHGDAFEWIAEYDCDVFAHITIERALRRFEHFVLAATSAPQAALSTLAMVPDDERDVLAMWGTGPARDLPSSHDVLTRVRARDESRKRAVVSAAKALTYRELASLRRRVAAQLVGAGIVPGDTVAVVLRRRAELPAVLLAVWEVGATYVPVDVSFPPERVDWMLQDSGAAVIYTEESLVSEITSPLPMLTLEGVPARAKATAAAPAPTAESAAYLIYTSGSTGRPKGVRIPHRAVQNFVASMCREPGISADDHLLAVTTISFDISVLELFAPLAAGGTVSLASEAESKDPEALLRLLHERNISVMQATPATWRLLLSAGWTGSPIKVLCGGEAMPRDLLEALTPRVASVWNMYGPTETTVWSTCAELRDPEQTIVIGPPIDNTVVRIVDNHGALQPVGVPGELLIGGAGLALGYQNRPALTAERFSALAGAPIGDASGSPRATGSDRWYRTGDVARWTFDGELVHLGRSDAQVKVRGFRIELGEIEAVAARCVGVSAVAVQAFAFGDGDSRLVGFYVSEGEVDSQELVSSCSAALPEYMVPRQWVRLSQLPLTPNGKLDRAALEPPHRELEAGSSAPRSEAERWLANVWERLTGMKGVRFNDNFFDIGGHSLLAMRLIHDVETETGVRLNALQLSTQTLAQVAATLPIDQTVDEASSRRTARCVRLVPEQLLGTGGPRFMLHWVPDGAPHAALLLVPPLLHEAQPAARTLRVLAERAAERGVHAARFDFWGTGDSAGELQDATLEGWLEDIVLAAQALRAASELDTITLVAPRLSAALVRAVAGRLGVFRFVAWSPIDDGADFVHAMKTEHLRWRERELRERPGALRLFDGAILGLSLPPTLTGALEALKPGPWPPETLVLRHSDDATASDAVQQLEVLRLQTLSPWAAGADLDTAPVAVDMVDAALRFGALT